jgi:hypothetical protein
MTKRRRDLTRHHVYSVDVDTTVQEIGHLKADHGMARNHLAGCDGDDDYFRDD